jgi:leucyl-tRNA synthetase
MENSNVKAHLEGKELRKVIYIPGKILNFVIS